MRLDIAVPDNMVDGNGNETLSRGMDDRDELARAQEAEAEHMARREARRETRTVEELLAEPQIPPALSPEVTGVVRIGDRWMLAVVRQPPGHPTIDDVLLTSGDILRSGHWGSLGEAFGFTWEDVGRMRALTALLAPDGDWLTADEHAGFVSLADRIESLLPPREP